jgi:hypothetical protein
MHWIHAQVVTFSCQIYDSRWSQYAASEGREPFPHWQRLTSQKTHILIRMLYNVSRSNYKVSLKQSKQRVHWEAAKHLNITFHWIFKSSGIWSFQGLLLSSSESGSTSVPFVTMLGPTKRHSIPPKDQDLRVQWHSVTPMLTPNLASHLALTSCYWYYIRINMIIQSIYKWYCRQCFIKHRDSLLHHNPKWGLG